jgi:TrmH family RNA methyltransferase
VTHSAADRRAERKPTQETMNHEKITSIHNPRIKAAVGLKKKRERDRLRRILIEGTREIDRALEGGIRIHETFYRSDPILGEEEQSLQQRLEARDIKLTEVSGRAFEKLVYRESSSCFVAVADKGTHALEDLPVNAVPLYLVVETVEKPGNLGAMLRSADAVGITGLICCDPAVDLYNPNVIRSSLGALFTVAIAVADGDAAAEWLRRQAVAVVTSTPHAATLYTGADLRGAVAIVVGSEERGVSDRWMDAADLTVKIPMRGKADSLNVSAAATVLLYEALRQRTVGR